MWELKRYGVYAAGISESKWFGSNIYEVEDHFILHSGRIVPGDGQQVRRGEGVGLVLSPEATRAWRFGGEEWEPVSSRIVTAKLRVKGGRSPQHLVLVSVYAPTFRASDEEKEDFFTDLRRTISTAPANSTLLVVGDWNARVGSYQDDEQSSRVMGNMVWGW